MVAHQTDALAHNRCWLDRTALEGQISAAQTALQAAIDQVQQNLDDAKAELDKAIADGDKALDDKIKALSDALAAAKTALDTTGETNKTVLEGQISAAQTTLQAAIDTLNERLVTAEDELTAVRSETKKSARYGDHRDLRSVCHSRCCDFDCCHDPDTKKQEMTSRKMLKHGDGKKFFRNFLPSPTTLVLAAFSRHFAATTFILPSAKSLACSGCPLSLPTFCRFRSASESCGGIFFVTCYEQEKSEPKAAWQRVRISIYLFPKENRCSVQARSICRCRHHARTSAMSIFFDSRRQAKTNFRTVLVSLRLFMPSIPDMPEFRKIILSFFPALPCGL